jgi:glycosyltransferase involved in cell wall biosynthesis
LKVSIVTIVFNGEAFIRKTIESVLSQSYSDIEYIIIDGGSGDKTMDIVNEYLLKIVTVVSEKDKGIYDAMNKGVIRSTGDIVGFLNADDIFSDQDSVKYVVESFKRHGVDAVYGDLQYINVIGGVVRNWRSKKFKKGLFGKSWTPAHPTFYCRKKIYEQYGLYKIDYKIAADVELMFRFLEIHAIRTHYISRVLVKMMKGGVSNSGLYSTITICRELIRAFNENDKKLNLLKYVFYKFLKVSQFIPRSLTSRFF